jgi:recombination protein RecA
VKNKVAPPFKQCEFEILYGEGTSREGELIDLGVKLGMIDKAGAWYSYNEERIGQGKDNVRTFLKEHKEMAEEIDARIRAEILPKPSKPSNKADSEAMETDLSVENPSAEKAEAVEV